MSNIELKVKKREKAGKGIAKAIRRDGNLPAVFYIRGEEAAPLIIEANELKIVLASKPTLITLRFEDDSEKEVIIREIQRDPVSEDIYHIDFMGITRGVKITATVPVELVGVAAGVKVGGIVEHLLREVDIEVLPKDLPDSVKIEISELEIGDSLHVSDLELENFKILARPETGVVNVVMPKVKIEEEVEEEELDEAAEGDEEAAEAGADETAEDKSE
ncbi:50S ribosomal protein L25 [candidate division KSB1 bacterium]